jgi:hypothetical protein
MTVKESGKIYMFYDTVYIKIKFMSDNTIQQRQQLILSLLHVTFQVIPQNRDLVVCSDGTGLLPFTQTCRGINI